MAPRNRKPADRPVHCQTLLVALAIASGSMSAHALTLGRLQVQSSMGEPLRAEIEITALSAEESQNLQVQIAPARSFQQAGMEYNPALDGLTARIDKRPGGRTFIVMQGNKPVQENFIDLILETQWSTGRLVRNYALLLNSVSDKPSAANPMTPARTAPAVAGSWPAPVVQPADMPQARIEYNAQNVPVYRFDSAHAPVASTAPMPSATGATGSGTTASTPVAPGSAEPKAQTLLVTAGQTASQLALAHKPESTSLDQMLVAMLRSNPQAFIQDNVNLVREGAVLRMPTAEQVQHIPAREARQIVLAQNREFAEYARRLAQTPLHVAKDADRETSGKVSVDAPQAADPSTGQDKLTLSKPQVSSDNVEARLVAEQEARDTAQQAAALQKNIDALKSLVPAASDVSSASPAFSADPNAQKLADKPLWPWGVGLAAVLGLFLWRRSRQTPTSESFAPSYDDEPLTTGPDTSTTSTPAIPPQMASIDLDLNAATPSPAEPQPSEVDTEVAKLELARVLLSKGDTAIARSLVQSVAETGTGELKARAQQLLSQFP